MNAKIIDGKQLAMNLRGEIAAGVAALKNDKGVTPGLAVILVGENPASVSYVTAKEKACAEWEVRGRKHEGMVPPVCGLRREKRAVRRHE